MSADLTIALGRLLADEALRRTLGRDPGEAARSLGVPEADLRALDPDALELQAEGLIDKRRHEVAKRLPRTLALLGDRAAVIFRDYAGSYWPEGHRRHVADASRFCDYLKERGLPQCRSECNRIRFAAGSWPLSAAFARDVWIGGRARGAVEVFLRFRGGVRSCALYLGFGRSPQPSPNPARSLGRRSADL